MTESKTTDFFITHRVAGQKGTLKEAHDKLEEHFAQHLEAQSDTTSQKKSAAGRIARRFQADIGAVQAAKTSLANAKNGADQLLLIEPVIRMGHNDPYLEHLLKIATDSATKRQTTTESVLGVIEVRVTTGAGAPIVGAVVTAVVLSGKIPHSLRAITGTDGVARITGATSTETLAMVMVSPHAGYWGVVDQSGTPPISVVCPALPQAGPRGWWHHVLNAGSDGTKIGSGVTVGVIDTGCGPSPQLAHVRDAGAIIGQQWTDDGADVGVHGTFSCGVIGARPQVSGDYAGLAQGACVVSLRVYPDDTAEANQMDVAMAIDRLSVAERADLINLSLYSMTRSDIQLDAIRNALDYGTLCVCSAGNSGGPVGWPAAFPETVAITGLGQIGCAPEGSVDSIFVPTDPAQKTQDDLYIATFSCRGSAVTASGPAVAGLAPVPNVPASTFGYAAMSGTSVAAPMICGALSAWLSRTPDYLALPRNQTRSAMALKILLEHVESLVGDPDLFGAGLLPLKVP